MNTQAEKQKAIAEINSLIVAWQPRWCKWLLEEAKRMHKGATAPLPIKDKHGKEFSERLAIHACDETGQKALCGHGDQIVSQEEFEKLPRSQCWGCLRSLKRLKGEKNPYVRFNWLMKSQEELIIAIYLASGRRANRWCTTTDLFPKTKYKDRDLLWKALRALEKHKTVEMKRQGNVCCVRLTCDCVVETAEGDPLVAIGKMLDWEKKKAK